MKAEDRCKTCQLDNQKEDFKEYLELIQTLTPKEKEQVKGIVIGMQLAKQQDIVA